MHIKVYTIYYKIFRKINLLLFWNNILITIQFFNTYLLIKTNKFTFINILNKIFLMDNFLIKIFFN